MYATEAQVRAYCAEDTILPDDAEGMAGLIYAASRDVDRLLEPLPVDPATGLKLTGYALTAAQAAALAGATAAAAEWRAVQGEDLLGESDGIASISGITFAGPPARPPGPVVIEELSGFGFPMRSGCAAPDPDEPDPT